MSHDANAYFAAMHDADEALDEALAAIRAEEDAAAHHPGRGRRRCASGCWSATWGCASRPGSITWAARRERARQPGLPLPPLRRGVRDQHAAQAGTQARRRDDGTVLTADSADALLDLIRADYAARPVSRRIAGSSTCR